MPFTDVSGARIYWKREGLEAAPPLVLLNSIGTDMALWEPVLPQLIERFAVLRIDTRGHGASAAEPGDFTLRQLAHDVLAVADAAGFEAFLLAGVSLGGMIGMELALQAPSRVAALALLCTSATMDPAAWNDRTAKVRAEGMAGIADLAVGRFLSDPYRAAHPGVADTIRRQLLSMDPASYAGCCAAIRDMDLVERIAGIGCPALVVTGKRDISTPYEGHGEHLVGRIPGAVHCSLAAAHLATLEAPAALGAHLIGFLGNVTTDA